MSKLAGLLKAGMKDVVKEEKIFFSARLPEEQATIRPMTSAQFSDYQKRAMAFGKKGTTTFNQQLYNELILLNHVVDPDFKDAATMKDAGVQTSEQLINAFLTAGEAAFLVESILRISGFGDSLDDLREQAKNS